MVTCYLDESGTDNDSSVAVVGGLVLDMKEYFWLDTEWRKCLAKHNLTALHMKDFGKHEKYGHLRSEERRAIFTDFVKVSNEYKGMSISCRLEADPYRSSFKGLTSFSMYGAAFLVVAMVNYRAAVQGGYRDRIVYLLDAGNKFKSDVLEAHKFLQALPTKYPSNIGPIGFDCDDRIPALQSADMVSYAVRSKRLSV